jgi:putative transposase
MEDLNRAWVNFFEGRACHPRPRTKRDTQSIRYPQRFKWDGSRIYLPKVGGVRAVIHRPLEGKAKSATVLKTKAGRYFVAIQCEVEIEPTPNGKPVGAVDLGLTHFATLATGEKVAHPKVHARGEKKLQRLQRQLSRKQKGSNRREKARVRLARQHERVANQRHDFLQKLSHRVVTEHGRLTLETLNVAGMMKNHCLAKAISDSGWSTFARFCEYKGAWYGCEVRRADRFFPSTQTCHACGFVNHALTLKDRVWLCPSCGREHDRDVNATLTLVNAPPVGATGSRSGRGRKTAEGFPSTQSSLNREAQPFTAG